MWNRAENKNEDAHETTEYAELTQPQATHDDDKTYSCGACQRPLGPESCRRGAAKTIWRAGGPPIAQDGDRGGAEDSTVAWRAGTAELERKTKLATTKRHKLVK